MTHHLGKANAPKDQRVAHAVGFACFNLAVIHRHKGPAKGFAHVGTEDKADGQYACGKGIEIDVNVDVVVVIQHVADGIDADLAAEEQQHHQH